MYRPATWACVSLLAATTIILTGCYSYHRRWDEMKMSDKEVAELDSKVCTRLGFSPGSQEHRQCVERELLRRADRKASCEWRVSFPSSGCVLTGRWNPEKAKVLWQEEDRLESVRKAVIAGK